MLGTPSVRSPAMVNGLLLWASLCAVSVTYGSGQDRLGTGDASSGGPSAEWLTATNRSLVPSWDLKEYAVEVGVDGRSTTEVRSFLHSSPHLDVLSETHIEPYGTIFHVRQSMSHARRATRSVDTFPHSLEAHLTAHSKVKRCTEQVALIRTKREVLDVVGSERADERARHYERARRSIVHDKQAELPELRSYAKGSGHHQVVVPSRGQPVTAHGHLDKVDMSKEFPFNDPFLPDQWYLINYGQAEGIAGLDLNVLPVWRKGFTGKGVVLTIMDDGIEHSHEDLKRNYDPQASADLNDVSDTNNDPSPNPKNLAGNSHGTRCAGEVAAEANNEVCGVGVAYNAKIGGIRMLDGKVTDMLEARSILYNNQHIDIYSASWGPTDNGMTMEGPGPYCGAALLEGVTKGRGGLGSIFMWATGNGGELDDCNADGYVSSPYTASIGSINQHARSSYFSEECPSTIAVVYTGGFHSVVEQSAMSHAMAAGKAVHPMLNIVTTTTGGRCTLSFQGTSSAAPLAAAGVALMLEANPRLNWRDVQHIIVNTCKVPNPHEPGWTINGAGFHVNIRFGFGVMDFGRMVEVAQSWISVTEQHMCVVEAVNVFSHIVVARNTSISMTVEACQKIPGKRIDRLEHVEMAVRLTSRERGFLRLFLTSPAGTRSRMLNARDSDKSEDGIDFKFMTVHCWGENPRGRWTLTIEHTGKPILVGEDEEDGILDRWSLIFRGTSDLDLTDQPSSASTFLAKAPRDQDASLPDKAQLQGIMLLEGLSSDRLEIHSERERPMGMPPDTSHRSVGSSASSTGSKSRSSASKPLHAAVHAGEVSKREVVMARIRSILAGMDPELAQEFVANLKTKMADHRQWLEDHKPSSSVGKP